MKIKQILKAVRLPDEQIKKILNDDGTLRDEITVDETEIKAVTLDSAKEILKGDTTFTQPIFKSGERKGIASERKKSLSRYGVIAKDDDFSENGKFSDSKVDAFIAEKIEGFKVADGGGDDELKKKITSVAKERDQWKLKFESQSEKHEKALEKIEHKNIMRDFARENLPIEIEVAGVRKKLNYRQSDAVDLAVSKYLSDATVVNSEVVLLKPDGTKYRTGDGESDMPHSDKFKERTAHMYGEVQPEVKTLKKEVLENNETVTVKDGVKTAEQTHSEAKALYEARAANANKLD